MITPTEEYFNNPIATPRFIKKNYPEFYDYLNHKYPDYSSIAEKIYLWKHKLDEAPKCIVCGNKATFKSLTKGYSNYCSIKCSNSSDLKKGKIKSTNLRKYGVENPMQSENVRNKFKSTCLDKYGVEYSGASLEVKNKIKSTLLNKYNIDSPLQLPQAINNREKSRLNKLKNKYEEFEEINDGVYVCKCPHPHCNKCIEKIYLIRPSVFFDRRRDKTEPCTKLLPEQKSGISNTTLELSIQNILDEYNIEYITNDRTILGGKELDIYIPSHNLAIECNGIFSHCNRHKDNNYHVMKSKLCRDKGIQLLHIWEDWVKNKYDIVKSIILSKLGIYDNRIYARKCVVRELDYDISSKFLEENHIQGNTKSNVKLGLYYKDELISVMLFSKRNGCIGGRFINNKEIELSRFCSKINTQVIGGASKLINYYIKYYHPISIVSFSSNDISNGNLYKKLGFESNMKYQGSYWWIKNGSYDRYHRSNFTKADIVKLNWKDVVDDTWTEEEVMYSKGYFKIVDSGQFKWILNL